MKSNMIRRIIGTMIILFGFYYIIEHMVKQYDLERSFIELFGIMIIHFFAGSIPIVAGLWIVFKEPKS